MQTLVRNGANGNVAHKILYDHHTIIIKNLHIDSAKTPYAETITIIKRVEYIYSLA